MKRLPPRLCSSYCGRRLCRRHPRVCWIEDASIAAVTIQYQAADLGLGSCWAQMHGRGLSDGTTADEVIHGILGLDDAYKVLCVIAIGHYTDERKPQNEDALKWENVTIYNGHD